MGEENKLRDSIPEKWQTIRLKPVGSDVVIDEMTILTIRTIGEFIKEQIELVFNERDGIEMERVTNSATYNHAALAGIVKVLLKQGMMIDEVCCEGKQSKKSA